MAANRLEAVKPAEEAKGEKGASKAPVAKPASGTKGWIPLIANVLLMPVVAYGITSFVLIPKIAGGKGGEVAIIEGHPETNNPTTAGGTPKKFSAALGGKILVNVAGTAGTRYLLANITLVSKRMDLTTQVAQNDAELRDAAASILSGKTIGDLEKPGMRNIIRAELIASFNDILGKGTVNDIYLTEFAVQ